MRCSCQNCGVYMIQSDDSHLGCVCPECGARCTACLGTDSVISKDALKDLKNNPMLAEQLMSRFAEDNDDGTDE